MTEPGPRPPLCTACGEQLPIKTVRLGYVRHKSCRPVACLACGQEFPKRTLRKLRCRGCRDRTAARPVKAKLGGHTPFERANVQRQEAERRQAKLLSERAPGPHSQPPPRATIVRGGLPGQGR
ncbi:hypothetical protein SUDANB95_02701 [Actinosynnema sp. ALI-1.44]